MKKWSKIWKVDLDELRNVVSQSSSFNEVVRKLGVSRGGSITILKKRLNAENIDFSHIPQGRNSNLGRTDRTRTPSNKFPLTKVMIKNSAYNRGSLKRRLIKNGSLKNECSICGLDPEWNGKLLVLVLDHKNGVNNDHRFENLRLLCPNCNSQTETFSGRNLKKNAL